MLFSCRVQYSRGSLEDAHSSGGEVDLGGHFTAQMFLENGFETQRSTRQRSGAVLPSDALHRSTVFSVGCTFHVVANEEEEKCD